MKSHSFDTISFVSGLIITALGLLFLIPNTPGDIIDALGNLGVWFWPILFLAIGLAVIIPVFIPKRSSESEEPEELET
jgi:Na+-driven multidrug efflux pump